MKTYIRRDESQIWRDFISKKRTFAPFCSAVFLSHLLIFHGRKFDPKVFLTLKRNNLGFLLGFFSLPKYETKILELRNVDFLYEKKE